MHNPENERIKRVIFIYLKEARRLREHSVDCAAAALAKFEEYAKYRDFKKFHIQQAIGFKRKLSEQISPRTGEQSSRERSSPHSTHYADSFCGSQHSPAIDRT
jgi:integrase/recombinase XerD